MNWVDPWGLETYGPFLSYNRPDPPSLPIPFVKPPVSEGPNWNLNARQEYYQPHIEERVKAGAAQMNAAVQVPFPPGHPLASKFQYDHWKKSHPEGNYWDFYLDNLRDPYTENCQD